ncbi:MAG: hypothetical protein HQL32_16730, partial [Planctomycetes bacterium]|nr:hypothetical protein [Planctomycetota bacterium]
MKSPFIIFFFMLSCSLWADMPPEFAGEWLGSFLNPPKGSYQNINPSLAARVVGRKDNTFEIQLMTEFDRRAQYDFNKVIALKNGKLTYSDDLWSISVEGQKMTGSIKTMNRKAKTQVKIPFELKKVKRISPTMGRVAPEGAEELFKQGLGK